MGKPRKLVKRTFATELGEVEVPLDETDNKLFYKPKRPKTNFEKTITKPGLTNSKHKSNVGVGRAKINKGKDMKNVKQGVSQIPKIVTTIGFSSVYMAWILDRYPSDLVPVIMAGLLIGVGAYIQLKK